MPSEPFSRYPFTADYQDLLIACLIDCPHELGELGELVQPSLFSGTEAFQVVYHIHDYRQKYGSYPSFSVLAGHVHRLMAHTQPERAEATAAYLTKLARINTSHHRHVRDSIREFACHQRIYRMINDTAAAMNSGTPPSELNLIQRVNDCMAVMTLGEDMGVRLQHDWERIVDGVGTTPGVFPGFPLFHDLWRDGWAPGWLISVLAPSKRFKTTFCVNVALNMAWADTGVDVIYYACELNQTELAERMLMSLSGHTRQDMRTQKSKVKQTISQHIGHLYGNVLIKSYPSKGATIATLKAHATQAISSYGIKPKAIFIDFAETIRPDSPKNTPDHRQQSEIYTQARAFGQEIGACIVMPDRANRETVNTAVPKITGFQGAIEKAGIADIGIGLCQTEKEHMNNVMRYFVFINRHGPEFLHYQGKVDPALSRISVDAQIPYDPDAPENSADNTPIQSEKRYQKPPRGTPHSNEDSADVRAEDEQLSAEQRASQQRRAEQRPRRTTTVQAPHIE